MKKFLLLIAILFICTAPTVLFSQEKKERSAAVEELVAPELLVVNNTLTVKNAPIGSRIEIITIVGNKVYEIEMKSPNGTYELNLPKAIYIFKLEGVVRKFVIK